MSLKRANVVPLQCILAMPLGLRFPAFECEKMAQTCTCTGEFMTPFLQVQIGLPARLLLKPSVMTR
jgi:hypothetical protein